MADSNRNLAAKVLVLLGDIAKAMGPPFDKGARPVVLSPAVANLADNKKQVWREGWACWAGVGIAVQRRAGSGLHHCAGQQAERRLSSLLWAGPSGKPMAYSSLYVLRSLHPGPCPPGQVRDGVLYMLDAWIGVASSDKLFPAVADAVANPKCLADGKVAGLQWWVGGSPAAGVRKALLKALAAGQRCHASPPGHCFDTGTGSAGRVGYSDAPWAHVGPGLRLPLRFDRL